MTLGLHPISASPTREFCRREVLPPWFHESVGWAAASETRSASGSVLLGSRWKNTEKGAVMKRWISIVFIDCTSSLHHFMVAKPSWGYPIIGQGKGDRIWSGFLVVREVRTWHCIQTSTTLLICLPPQTLDLQPPPPSSPFATASILAAPTWKLSTRQNKPTISPDSSPPMGGAPIGHLNLGVAM